MARANKKSGSPLEVEDVTYLTDYAQSYVDGTNPDVDYTEDENGNVMDTHTTLTYTIESL